MRSREPREHLRDKEWLKEEIKENALHMQSDDQEANSNTK